jgi:hypothetical protein
MRPRSHPSTWAWLLTNSKKRCYTRLMGKRRTKHLGLTTGKPILGTPTLRQVHRLKADDLVGGPPILGEPRCSEGPPKPPTADLVTGAPILGTPTLRQVHHITVAADHAGTRQTTKAREVKTAKAGARRDLIEKHARDYWARVPEAVEKKSTTARKIAPVVRADLPNDDKHKNEPEDPFLGWVRKNLPQN